LGRLRWRHRGWGRHALGIRRWWRLDLRSLLSLSLLCHSSLVFTLQILFHALLGKAYGPCQ
jgi:hypothetical protein